MSMERKTLLFLIDTTGSMGSWISALSAILPSTIRSLALTRVFDQVEVVSYTDYDQKEVCSFSGICQCDNAEQISSIQQFSSRLVASGGGGAPEAWKTALEQIRLQRDFQGPLFILHLTDAPPHVDGQLDSQGKMEKQSLGEQFGIFGIFDRFCSRFPGLRYTSLTSHCHPFYCYLAQRTEGYVHKLTGGSSPDNIRSQIGCVFNGWFGFDNPCSESVVIDLNIKHDTELSLSSSPVSAYKGMIKADKALSSSLSSTLNKLKFDPDFLEHVIKEMSLIIEENPISLTISPILGRMWRELCKRRHDVRRDELISQLSRRKNSLGPTEKNILEEWLKDSYNATSEILQELATWMELNSVQGLLRFVPEDESLCAQQVVQLLAAGDKKSTMTIRAILTRMYFDQTYTLGKCTLSDDDDFPLPERSIPLNLKPAKVFELLMHTVASGTKLTRRYAALLALHAIQCDCILSDLAVEFLSSIKGKWINWKRREDRTVEVPDCWSVSFLNLILLPRSVFALTDEEIKQATFFRKVSFLLRFFRQTEVTVKVVDPNSVDGQFPDHQITCSSCSKLRPLSLISSNGTCGYCLSEGGPEEEVSEWISVRCYPCGSIYQRNRFANIPGYSKCFQCRQGGDRSPSVQCSTCKLNFVQFFETSKGLPGGQCGSCANQLPPRQVQFIDKNALAHQVIPGCYFSVLCKSIGFVVQHSPDGYEWNSGTPLYDAVTLIQPGEIQLSPPPSNIKYREAQVQNIDDIWQMLIGVMSGSCRPIMPECSICLDEFSPGHIVPACGRKACTQRVCNQCAEQWFSKNTPGQLIYQRATMCQFCSRIPSPKTLGRIHPRLIALASAVAKNRLEVDVYYGWCQQCFLPHEVGRRECSQDPPVLTNFICSSCSSATGSKSKEFKECPKCSVMTEKISGCNHIFCTSCDSHWCWKCSTLCPSSEDTYQHMNEVHSSFFDDEGDIYDEDDFDD